MTPGNTTPAPDRPRRGRRPAQLPDRYAAIHAGYTAALAAAGMLDDNTRRAYASRVRGYLIWLDAADLDGDPLTQPHARDGAVRDYRSHLQTVAKRKPSTINTTLAAIGDLYLRLGLGAPDVRRLDLPQAAPRALSERDITRWLRTVERWVNPRDRVLALIPFYAGLRLGEVVALNLDDIALSARKGLITVRAGKGERYREVPIHAGLRPDLTLWINDERPTWPGAADTSALLLNHRGARLSARGAHDVIGAIANQAGIGHDFTSHALRHTFGTTLVRDGHDLVLVAELMGHARLDQTRRYSLPTQADRELAAAAATLSSS
ncbi:tyrosine-type recombinase/integrase [Kribbella sp. CA-293567]|uniref:tyrosine-type recombinase/integrase n=1 Tax=Kribbella sp. CA-293567 TaxID=3002436 RepID=UPI0022DE43B2|nr:tyrosine-type recombinase/integrase [Kribbella sp. CA-293567]WBQ03410.1 tyrosine-type recombinase/integrase [Kribbella sp. CA-293567]